MTTVAFDGRYVAADGHVMRSELSVSFECVKLWMGARHVYTGFGLGNWDHAWFEWAENGGDPNTLPPHASSSDTGGGFVRIAFEPPHELMSWSHNVPYMGDKFTGPAAFGSGGHVARGAMLAGADAMTAVVAAGAVDPNTKGIVRYVDLLAPGLGVMDWHEIADIAIPNVAKRYIPVNQPVPPFPATGMPHPWNDFTDHVSRHDVGCPLREGLCNCDLGKPEPVEDVRTITINKPRPEYIAEDGRGSWAAECQGLLTLGTGCGRCLRCNREWHVLKKKAAASDFIGMDMLKLPVSKDDNAITSKIINDTGDWIASVELLDKVDELCRANGWHQVDAIFPLTATAPVPQCYDAILLRDQFVELSATAPFRAIAIQLWMDKLKGYGIGIIADGELIWRIRPEIKYFPDEGQWKVYGRLTYRQGGQKAAESGLPISDLCHDDPKNLFEWVLAWNRCVESEAVPEFFAKLDRKLHHIVFPPNVVLVDDVLRPPRNNRVYKAIKDAPPKA